MENIVSQKSLLLAESGGANLLSASPPGRKRRLTYLLDMPGIKLKAVILYSPIAYSKVDSLDEETIRYYLFFTLHRHPP
jgi:hypothetical protein